MRHPLAVALWGAALLFAAVAADAAGGARLVLMRPADATGAADATALVREAMAAALSARGWETAPGPAVEEVLQEARLRSLDSLPASVLERFDSRLGSPLTVLTTIVTWLPGENPIVALSARALDRAGTTVWSGVAALTGNDTAGLFGFGRLRDVEQLGRRAVRELLADFPPPGARVKPSPAAARRPRPGLPAPATWRSGELFGPEPLRICLLPLAVPERAPAAGHTVTVLLARRLAASGAFAVVEPADFQAALRSQRVYSPGRLRGDALREFGRELGTSLFLRGAVWNWREGNPWGLNVAAEVELELELVDVESGRILWSAHHERRGAQYLRTFLRGGIGSAAGLADQLIAEMIDQTRRTPPAPPRTLRFANAASEERIASQP
ncbi:MAG TPA: CsgG/HfaB family protein [Thermoanaerobaculia bacterium]|nr:CsgG/HfaB family protein [Thermoanaerobaculia bacterium]